METKGATGSWLSDLFGATRPDSRRLRETLRDVSNLPKACIEKKLPAGGDEPFHQWQAAVLHYHGIGHAERLPKVLAYAVETQGSVLGGGPPGQHKVEGIGASFVPKNFDRSVCDGVIMVTDSNAFGMVKELAAREGVLSGSSGGANVFAALDVARKLGTGKQVVTVIPDSAERYLSKKIFEGGI